MPSPAATDPGSTPGARWRAARARGFTIIEMMIAVTVLAILSAVALPSLTNFVRDQRVKAATSDVFSSLIYARSEAIKRSADINIIPTNTANWATGWRVADAGGNNLRIQGAIPSVTITISGNPATIVYRRDGRLTAAVNPFVLSSPDSTSITARCVRLDPSGRPNVKVDSNGNPADGCQ